MARFRVGRLGGRTVAAAAVLLFLGGLPGCGRISARRSLKAGNAAYTEDRYALALENFAKVPLDAPERMQALLGIAYVHMAQFRPGSTKPENVEHVKESVKAFDDYLKLRPKDTKDPNLPGPDQVEGWVIELLVGSEGYEEAIARMEAALKLKADDPAMLRGIAQAYEKWGKLVDAVAYYRKWAATFPNDPAPHVAIAAFCWNISYRRAQGLEAIERNRWIDTGIESAQAALRISAEHFEGLTYHQLLLRERAKMRIDPDVIADHLQRANEILGRVSEMRKKKKAEEEAAKAKAATSPAPESKSGGAS